MATIKYKNPATGEWEAIGMPTESVGMQMDLLWTNLNPDVEFAPQTLNIHGVGDSELYKYLLVETDKNVQWFENKVSDSYYLLMSVNVAEYGAYINSRQMLISVLGELTLKDNAEVYGKDSSHTRKVSNNNNRPIRIYGIRNTSSANPSGDGATESINHPGCFYRMVNGVQEWLNPPMEVGVEYKTTERFMGKPVYAKAVSTGALPSTKGIAGRIRIFSDAQNVLAIVGCECVTTNNSGYAAVLPHYTNNAVLEAYLTDIGMNEGNPYVYIESGRDMSSYTGVITWKYTKTTD